MKTNPLCSPTMRHPTLKVLVVESHPIQKGGALGKPLLLDRCFSFPLRSRPPWVFLQRATVFFHVKLLGCSKNGLPFCKSLFARKRIIHSPRNRIKAAIYGAHWEPCDREVDRLNYLFAHHFSTLLPGQSQVWESDPEQSVLYTDW